MDMFSFTLFTITNSSESGLSPEGKLLGSFLTLVVFILVFYFSQKWINKKER